MEKERRYYSKEFKEETLGLVAGGRSVPDVVQELGLNAGMINRWRREKRAKETGSFPGQGHLAPIEEE